MDDLLTVNKMTNRFKKQRLRSATIWKEPIRRWWSWRRARALLLLFVLQFSRWAGESERIHGKRELSQMCVFCNFLDFQGQRFGWTRRRWRCTTMTRSMRWWWLAMTTRMEWIISHHYPYCSWGIERRSESSYGTLSPRKTQWISRTYCSHDAMPTLRTASNGFFDSHRLVSHTINENRASADASTDAIKDIPGTKALQIEHNSTWRLIIITTTSIWMNQRGTCSA